MLIASTLRPFGHRLAPVLLIAMTLMLAVGLAGAPAHAALEVDITKGQVEPMPIALPNFLGNSPEEQQYGLDIVTVIGTNLERSGSSARCRRPPTSRRSPASTSRRASRTGASSRPRRWSADGW
jgi:hypothetical protein